MTCGAPGKWTIGSRRKVSGMRSGQRVKAILAAHSAALREQAQADEQATASAYDRTGFPCGRLGYRRHAPARHTGHADGQQHSGIRIRTSIHSEEQT